MQVLFENEQFVAIDKPPGWLSVPSRAGEADARPCAGIELMRQLGCRLWPVHRLDAEVSGLLLFAKNAAAHRAANTWFEGRGVHKTYEALTEGDVGAAPRPGETVEWRSSLARGKKRAYESPHGKLAVTRATFVGVRGQHLEWRLEPLTGRSHQLRVHLAQHGFPIVGDALYGAKRARGARGEGEDVGGGGGEGQGAVKGDGERAREGGREGGIMLRAVRLDFSGCADAPSFGLPKVIEAPRLQVS